MAGHRCRDALAARLECRRFVAEDAGHVVGCGLGAVAGGVGWIYRVDTVNGEGGHELLDALSTALATGGARVIATVSGDGDALAERGFRPTGASVFDRAIAHVGSPVALNAVGARIIPPGLWDELRGMDEAKEIIERRVILPLAEPGSQRGTRSRSRRRSSSSVLPAPGRRHSRRGSPRGSAGRSSRSSRPRSARKAQTARRNCSPTPSTGCSSCRRRSCSSTRSRTSPRSATRNGASARTSRTSS